VKTADTLAALCAEIAGLKAEVEALRTWQATHVCAQPVSYWPTPTGPPCTCGTTVVCQRHPMWRQQTNYAAGCAGQPVTYVVNTAAGQYPEPLNIYYSTACAAAAVPAAYTYTIPAP
jgi:hypothetical protein